MKSPAAEYMQNLLGNALEHADTVTNATSPTPKVKGEQTMFQANIDSLRRFLASLEADVNAHVERLEQEEKDRIRIPPGLGVSSSLNKLVK